MTSLDLALVGNGTIGALIDARASVVWCCFPRFDGDPAFCSLLDGGSTPDQGRMFSIELVGTVRTEQNYLADTPILVTRFYDTEGAGIEITDFCPRFEGDGGLYTPIMLVRQVRPIRGEPDIVVRLNPGARYGCSNRTPSENPDHISYAGDPPLRLITDAPTKAIIDEEPFRLTGSVTLILSGGENSGREVASAGSRILEQTAAHWRDWVRSLTITAGWRDAIVRAAITLELNVFEETGAIIAAITTSIPEAPHTRRTWDYRYCWPRDACFVVSALGRLGEVRTTGRFLAFLGKAADAAGDSALVPMYRIDGGPIPPEHDAECLTGYRGMGPVRIGNKASSQRQNDIYGEAILSAEPLFLSQPPGSAESEALFARLERFGEHAARLYDAPDAGLWELRGAERVHTFSSVMCWVACDRLAKYAATLELADRSAYWRARATRIHDVISSRSWNERLNAFTATMEGDSLDASLLLMPRLGFLEPGDPRFEGTVSAIEKDLKHGALIYRYSERDDFGHPENAFLVCTFWYIEALAGMGGVRREQARVLFEIVLSARNRHGLLAEDLDPRTFEQWGNFPQTYCMAGIIDCALSLADPAG